VTLRPPCCVLIAPKPIRMSACHAAAKGEESYDCKYAECSVAITDNMCHNLLGYSVCVLLGNFQPLDLCKCGSQNVTCLCIIYMVNLSVYYEA
jgi:hypothetical protein